jgi:hypothetical protein
MCQATFFAASGVDVVVNDRWRVCLHVRTKTERPATILLPNSVAAHCTKRDEADGRAEIFK